MIDIVEKVIESKAKKIKLWPVNSNRASELGHPCDRYLVYLRTRGMERPLHDIGLQFIFDDGNLHEDAVLKDLREAGIVVIEQQRSFEWKKYQITGSIDAKIKDNGNIIPIEIKSFSDWNWRAINSAEDMFKSKAVYMKKYPAQLTLYLIMDEKEDGVFILKNKVNGLLKQIPLKLDFAYAESLIQKAERVNGHIQAGTLPDRISYDDNVSGTCPFAHICLPDVDHKPTILDDPELEIQLDRRGDLLSLRSEFEELDKEIKAKLKEVSEAVIGKWMVKGKLIEKNMPAKEAYTQKYWDCRIKKI
jgi:hypothetical protein